jgi:hypothetical protein
VLIATPWMRKTSMKKKVKETFVHGNFELAVGLYVLKLGPTNDLLFVDRAQTYIKLDKFTSNCNFPFI